MKWITKKDRIEIHAETNWEEGILIHLNEHLPSYAIESENVGKKFFVKSSTGKDKINSYLSLII